MMIDLEFYRGKRVLVTGHTGFKGSWMCVLLSNLGADVIGYSSCSPKEISLFDLCGIKSGLIHIKGDIRDLDHLKHVFEEYQPEIVIHMAAQPIVRIGYSEPVATYEVNVMGTVNVLECVRQSTNVKSFLNVTTDKVYLNKEWEWGYRETDPLDGYDPYSNSKSCSELVTHCYNNSFFQTSHVGISTARAGNVIGGGDFAKDRIVPDCVRSVLAHRDIVVRNPHAIRPYQHVLEPICAYLMIAAMQYQNRKYSGYYNIGPMDHGVYETGKIADLFVKYWGEGARWISVPDDGPHEARFLRLDCSRIASVFGWRPCWDLDMAIKKVVEWTKCWSEGGDVRDCMDKQIGEYLGCLK